jgi:choline monooxygenase
MTSDFDPTLPLARARTIPADWYRDPAVAAAERAVVFGRTWQCVGRTDQVKNPGDFLTADVAGDPVLVVRGEDGVLTGFFNVCRHRAAPLCTGDCGTVTKLRCRYHGWTYDLAGRLKGTPEFDGVQEFDKADNGLVPLGGVETWGPFVFVHLAKPDRSLADFLDPLPAWVESRGGFGDLAWFARRTYDLACNWKVYVDNYLDGGYHVTTVHPALAGVLDYKRYTTTTHARTSLQASPLTPGEGDAGRTRTGDLAAYWWAFPNFMVNLYSGVMDTNVVWPLGPDRCRVVFDFYFAAGTDAAFAEESIRVADRVQAEDVGICEQVQTGLGSSAYTVGRFSVKREAAGYHFQRLLAASVAGPGSAHGQTR